MRKTKAFKRVLSLLLVMLLMASMLPMSSLAADATSKEEASIELSGNPSEYVTMTLMAGKSLYHGATGQAFPKTTALTTIRTGYTGSNSGASNAVGYNYEAYTLETEDDYVTVKSSEANKQTLDSVAAKANGLFKDETNAGATAIEVARGDTFYVAFNLEGTLSDYKGLAGGSISLAIPTSAFSTSMASTAILNGLVSGGGFSNPADPSSLSAVSDYLAYAGGYTVDSRGTNDNLTFGNGQTGAAITLAAGGNYYLPTKAEWVAVVPVTVKADAPVGTYYIGSSTASGGQDNATAVLWNNAENGTGDIVSTKEGADKTTGTLKANAIEVKVTDPSAKPGADPDKYQDKVTNIPNYPYVTVASDKTATDYMDTLTFPAEENVFVEGDTVIFYAAKKTGEDTYEKGEELGRTRLTNDATGTGGSGLDNGVFTDNTVADKASVAGKTVYLLGYDSANDTWKQNPGYGYLKGESKVFLARLETGKDPSEAIGPIDIDPEDPVYYTGNTSYVLGNNPGAKEDNPIKIKLGDTVADVLAQITATDPDMNAPYENALGNTVSPALKAAWGDAALYDGSLGFTQDGVDAATGEYCKHGKFLLVNPYKSTTATMPDGTTVTVRQPSVYYTTPSQIPAAGYGQAIYVQVDPNPADYYLANPDPEDNFLYVVGKTKQYMTDGDRIRLYTTGDPSTLIATLPFKGNDVTNGLYKGLDLNNHSEITAGGKVLLTYTNAPVSNDKESEKVEIPVTDGKTAIVASDVEVTDADGTEFNISPDTNWERFVKYIGSATFTVNGPPAADNTLPSQELVLSKAQILEWTNKDAAAQARLNVTETTTKYNDNDALKTALLNASDTNTLTKETAFEASFVIPTSTELKASLPNGDLYDGEYANPAAYSVKAAAAVRRTIHISGKELSVSVKENKPLGDDYKDTIEISGDELGELNSVFTSLQTGGTRPADLTNFEIVLYDAVTGQEVGSVSDPADFKEAKVVHADGEADTYTYTLYVNQTARDIGTKLELYTVNPQGGNAYIAEFEVGVQEEYALMGVDAPAPERIQLLKDDILTFLGSAVTDPDTYTITKDDILNYLAAANAEDSSVTNAAALGLTGPQRRFGYYMSVKELNELNQTVTKIKVDPSATYTEEVDTPFEAAKWAETSTNKDYTADYVTLTFQNGTNNENILKPDAADRKNAGSTLPINADSRSDLTPVTWQVKVVEGQYTNEPVDPASLASTAVIQNNPYPQDDVLKLNITKEDGKDYTGLVAEVYVDNVHVGKVDIENAAAGEVAVTLDTGKDSKTLLNSMGGKVSVRLHTDGLALSDPASANYGAEDYVLWSVAEVDPTTVGVQYQDIQADVLAGVKAKLPKTLTATAVHLGPASGAVGVEPRTGAEESITVTLPVQNWLKAGDVITAADFEDAASLTGSDSKTYTLNADYDVTAAAAKTALINNANGTAQDVALIDPATLTGVTAPVGFNVSDPLDLQIGGTDFEHVKTKKTLNTGVVVTNGPKQSTTAADHVVKVYVPVDEATALGSDFVPGSTHAILKYQDASGAVRFFVSNDTLTVQETVKIGEADTNCYVITVNTAAASLNGFTDPEDTTINYEAFQGLNLSGGQVEAWLIEIGKNKSDSVVGIYEKADAALPLTDDILLANVHLTAGSLTTNQQVLDLAPYTDANTTLGTQNVTIPLVSDGASTPKVSWTLWYSDTGIPGGANAREIDATYTPDPTEEDPAPAEITNYWAEVLKEVPTLAGSGYYLVAGLDVANAKSGGNPISITNSGNKVAFVKLSLYTDYDPENDDPTDPKAEKFVLTDGNNDLWLSSGTAGTPASKKLAALQAEDSSITALDYRTDLVFWYRYETAEDVQAWEELEGSVKRIGTAVIENGYAEGEAAPATGTHYATLADWIAADPDNRSVAVKELNADGTEINNEITIRNDQKITLTSINPQHVERNANNDIGDYFESNTAGGIHRRQEFYVIKYTIQDGADTYYAFRNVKLTYRPGDANLDLTLDARDAGLANQFYAQLSYAFVEADGTPNRDLSVLVVDMNEDSAGDARDAGLMNQAYAQLVRRPMIDNRY